MLRFLRRHLWLVDWGDVMEMLRRSQLHYSLLEPLVQSHQHTEKSRPGYELAIRVRDTLLSLCALFFAIPLVIVFGIAIKLETPGPIFHKQIRMGKDGACFTLYKLRSMIQDAEPNGAQWASKDDPRVTRVGRFMRRTHIDELPQIINVLKGEMSIVGPRPERPELTMVFEASVSGFTHRLRVKPGLTGLAQINGGYELTPEQKLRLDLRYIENRSLWLDTVIIAKTIVIVVTGRGVY